MEILTYLIFSTIILILIKYIIKYNIHKIELKVINYYYFQKRYLLENQPNSFTTFYNIGYIGIYNYPIPHNNIYESFVIIMLLENIKNITNLRRIIIIFRPSTIILSHLLRFVVYDYNKEIILMLLSYGADPNIELNNHKDKHYKEYFILDHSKKLPLFTDIILSTKQHKIAKLFIESGKVNIEKCNKYYITPVIAAFLTYNTTLVKLILEYDTTNINYHQFYIKKSNESLEFDYNNNIHEKVTYFKFVSHLPNNMIYNLNIIELILLLYPYKLSHDSILYKKLIKKYKKKYNYNSILSELCFILINKGININKHYDWKIPYIKNTSLCFEMFYKESIRINGLTNIILLNLIKNGIYLDYKDPSNGIYLKEILILINKIIGSANNLPNHIIIILRYIKKYFISCHTNNDICLLQKISDNDMYKNLFAPDLVLKVKEYLYKKRYDNYITSLFFIFNNAKKYNYGNKPLIKEMKNILL